MLLLLAVILGVAWILGFGVYHVASAAIHVLLVLALVGASWSGDVGGERFAQSGSQRSSSSSPSG